MQFESGGIAHENVYICLSDILSEGQSLNNLDLGSRSKGAHR